MEKAEVESVLGQADSGPIDTYLALLSLPDRIPEARGVAICTLRIEESAPALRAMLEKAASGANLSDAEWALFFQGVHILGGARDQASFQPLLRLLRLPSEDIENLLGDAITDAFPRIAASVFDGDADALFDAIADRSVDQFARNALLGAAAFLTADGRIAREKTEGFLRRFGALSLAAGDDDIVWLGWAQVIALLGFRTLAPQVKTAFAKEYLFAEAITPGEFEADLAAAERAPDDKGRFERAGLGYIEDVLEALEPQTYSEDVEDEEPPPLPITNPFRDVGRNDPCPCGSGKKAKKCCLANG